MNYYEKTTKENCIKKCQSKVERYTKLLEYYELFKDTLREFDGKVYNRRFLDALKTKTNNERCYVSQGDVHLNYDETVSYLDICVKIYPEDSWTDEVYMTMRVYVNVRRRINASASLTHKYVDTFSDNIKNNITALRETITNYDKYICETEKLRKMIDEYNCNVPYPFRQNILDTYFRVYAG